MDSNFTNMADWPDAPEVPNTDHGDKYVKKYGQDRMMRELFPNITRYNNEHPPPAGKYYDVRLDPDHDPDEPFLVEEEIRSTIKEAGGIAVYHHQAIIGMISLMPNTCNKGKDPIDKKSDLGKKLLIKEVNLTAEDHINLVNPSVSQST